MNSRQAAIVDKLVDLIRRVGRRVTSHPRLKSGHVFQPRCYPSALRVQKKVRRKLRGLAATGHKYGTSRAWSSPLTRAQRHRNARRRARRLVGTA